jgi:cytochrome P450 family 109
LSSPEATIASRPIRWDDWADDPYPLYRRLRDEAPVYFDEGSGAYVITRYDDVAAVFRDHHRFSSRAAAEVTGEREQMSPIKEEDPPAHTYRRRIIGPLFTIGQMRKRTGYFQRVAGEVLSGIDGDVEVSSQIAAPLAGRVTCDLLGIPFEHQARFRELTLERIAMLYVNRKLPGATPGPAGARTIDDVRADLWEIVGPLVSERESDPREDAISLLINAEPGEGGEHLDSVLFMNMLLTLIAGGLETTQHLVEMLAHLLADRPDLWQRLRDDRSLVDPAIEEMLRWDAPFQAGRRRALDDVEIRGVRIPRDSTLMPVCGSANRDEREFTDPDRYNLDRDLTRHMGFGLGIHYCPGAPVSRFEVRALLDAMLDQYVSIERAGPSQGWPGPKPKLTVEAMRGYQRFPVRLRRA